jgi:hypothetical protein
MHVVTFSNCAAIEKVSKVKEHCPFSLLFFYPFCDCNIHPLTIGGAVMRTHRSLLSILLISICWTCSAGGLATAKEKFGLRVILGLKSQGAELWDGIARVTNGTVDRVSILDRGPEDMVVADNAWEITTAMPPRRLSRGAISILRKQGKDLKEAAKRPPAHRMLHLDIDGTNQSTVSIRTSQGNFSFRISDIQQSGIKRFMQGRVAIKWEPYAWQLSEDKRDDDYPSITVTRDGRVFSAWVSYVEGKQDHVYLRGYEGGQWASPNRVTDDAGDVLKTALGEADDGAVWTVWSQQVKGNFDLYGRSMRNGKFGKVQRLTSHDASDIHHRMVTDGKGRLWLTWQSMRDNNSDIYVMSLEAGAWSEPMQVTSDPSNDWEPDIAADKNGRVYIVWDSFRHGDYDVYLRSLENGEFSEEINLSGTGKLEVRPSVACDDNGSVWVAWDEGDSQWGQDTPGGRGLKAGAFKTEYRGMSTVETRKKNVITGGLGRTRQVALICYKDGIISRVQGKLPGRSQMFPVAQIELPMVTVDNNGTPRLFFRGKTDTRAGRDERFAWNLYMMQPTAKGWATPVALEPSPGRLDHRSAVAVNSSGDIWVAWPTDERSMHPLGEENLGLYNERKYNIYATRLRAVAVPSVLPNLKVVGKPNNRAVKRIDYDRRRYTTRIDGQDYTVYWGDLHRHTDVSADGGGDGSFMDLFRYAYDPGGLDFISITDHFFGQRGSLLREKSDDKLEFYDWWRTQKMTDAMLSPNLFIPFHGYERSMGFPRGHRNVINLKRGYVMTPIFTEQKANRRLVAQDDEKQLWKALKGQEAITIPHTIANEMGTDWSWNNPEYETLVELYQGCRSAYEYPGAPKSPNDADPQFVDKKYEAGYVWNALEKGYKIGFIASSDHNSQNLSYAAIYSKDFTREGIFEGMKSRRAFAATDHIIVDMRINGHMLGEAFSTNEIPKMTVKIIGTGPLKQVDIIKDNTFLYTITPTGSEVEFELVDKNITPGEHYYYVRVQQEDEAIAWGSPIWVQYSR